MRHYKKYKIIVTLLIISIPYFSIVNAQTYREIKEVTFDGFEIHNSKFTDLDCDGDLDILTVVSDSTTTPISTVVKSYKHIRDNQFVNYRTKTIKKLYQQSIFLVDLDGDDDLDILQSGSRSYGKSRGLMFQYENIGEGKFTQFKNTVFEGYIYSAFATVDIDGDNDLDIIIMGDKSYKKPGISLYENIGYGNYRRDENIFLNGLLNGSISCADIDNDGDQDVLIIGEDESENTLAKVYKNNGEGKFTEIKNNPFKGVYFCDSEFADIDGDGDQDLLIIGENANGSIANLYKNNSKGEFQLIIQNKILPMDFSSINFIDVDNDADLDIFVTGNYTSEDDNDGYRTILYLNDGMGNFEISPDSKLINVSQGHLDFADLDNDGDKDILISGEGNETRFAMKLYKYTSKK